MEVPRQEYRRGAVGMVTGGQKSSCMSTTTSDGTKAALFPDIVVNLLNIDKSIEAMLDL